MGDAPARAMFDVYRVCFAFKTGPPFYAVGLLSSTDGSAVDNDPNYLNKLHSVHGDIGIGMIYRVQGRTNLNKLDCRGSIFFFRMPQSYYTEFSRLVQGVPLPYDPSSLTGPGENGSAHGSRDWAEHALETVRVSLFEAGLLYTEQRIQGTLTGLRKMASRFSWIWARVLMAIEAGWAVGLLGIWSLVAAGISCLIC